MNKNRYMSLDGTRGNLKEKIPGNEKSQVSVYGKELIASKDRTYGYVKALQISTPFPQKAVPVDHAALTAKLEIEERKSANMKEESDESEESEQSEVKFIRTYPNPLSAERVKAFALRRKQFDEGEFTICQGRKITDHFHPIVRTSRQRGNSMVRHNLDEMAAYCKANNFQIIHQEILP